MVVDACHSTADCRDDMQWGADVVNSPFKYATLRTHAAAAGSVIAEFHYTDPTGPDKLRALCRRQAKFHYTETTTKRWKIKKTKR